MLIIGCADIDNVDVRILRDITEISRDLDIVSDFVRVLARAVQMGGADHGYFGFVARQIEEERDVQMPVCVDFANEAATYETNTVSFHKIPGYSE